MTSADTSDPRAHPAVSDEELSEFPPILFVTGTRAFEMSLAIVAHAKFLNLDVDSQLYVREQGVHGSILSHKSLLKLATPTGTSPNGSTRNSSNQGSTRWQQSRFAELGYLPARLGLPTPDNNHVTSDN